MEMRSGYFFFINLMVWRTTSGSYCTQCQNLSSGQKALQPVRYASPVTVQSKAVGTTYLIGISHRYYDGDCAMVARKFSSDRIFL